MKIIKVILFLAIAIHAWSQQLPVNCNLAVSGCSTPSFAIVGTQPAYNIADFTSNSVSNPSSNPNSSPGNSGCLLSGETVSTFISINIVSSGTLQWSLIGSQGGCFDWIMWNISNGNGCSGINGNSLPPVACNWNGTCNGNTGMAAPGNLPPGGSQSSYEYPINVSAGQSYMLCLSNYSFTNQNVNLNFFGSAQVVCGVSSPDQTICLGNTASVTISTPGYNSPTFNWLVTNGVSNTSGGVNVQVNPSVTTDYAVVVTQVNPPLQDTAYFTITVVPPPTPSAGSDQLVCLGQAIFLDGTESIASNASSWTVNTAGITPTPTINYSPNANAVDPGVMVSQPGIYSFVFSENNTICPVARDTALITVSATSHTTTFTSPSCHGMSDGTITINNPDGVLFSFDGGTSFGPNSTQSGLPVGTYTVVSENQYGCQYTSTVNVTEPLPILISAGNDTLICANGAANLWASISVAGLNEEYRWSFGGSTAANISVTPPTSTTISVYAEAANGCLSDTTTVQVDVTPLPIPSISVLNNGLCEPQVVTVDLTTDPTTVGTILWQVGNGQIFTNQNSISTDTLWAGLYDVNVMIVSPQGCIDSVRFTNAIDVRPQPNANFIFAPSPVMMLNTEVEFTNFSTNSDSYIWSFGGGDPGTSTTENQTVQFPEGVVDTYEVTLIALSNLGCSDTITKIVQVHPEILIYAPTAFTPDDDEYNQQWQVIIEGIDIYDFTLLIYNRWGELIWESHDPSVGWDGTYKGNVVQQGTYNWRIETKDWFNDGKYIFQGSFNLLR